MMHHQIVFTPDDVIAIVHSVCTMIGEIAVVVGALVAFFAWLKKPKEKRIAELADHEQRIKSLEEKCDDYKHFFQSFSDRMIRMDTADRAYQRGMLALINHAVDGNNIDELKECRKELTEIIYASPQTEINVEEVNAKV